MHDFGCFIGDLVDISGPVDDHRCRPDGMTAYENDEDAVTGVCLSASMDDDDGNDNDDDGGLLLNAAFDGAGSLSLSACWHRVGLVRSRCECDSCVSRPSLESEPAL